MIACYKFHRYPKLMCYHTLGKGNILMNFLIGFTPPHRHAFYGAKNGNYGNEEPCSLAIDIMK